MGRNMGAAVSTGSSKILCSCGETVATLASGEELAPSGSGANVREVSCKHCGKRAKIAVVASAR